MKKGFGVEAPSPTHLNAEYGLRIVSHGPEQVVVMAAGERGDGERHGRTPECLFPMVVRRRAGGRPSRARARTCC
jgi:hypothetical protein